MAQELVAGSRMMSVITSRGEAKKIAIAPAVITWKQLQVILTQAGYVLSNMKVVESVGKTTLEHPEAVVPTINFRLYIMPMESKSGARAAAKAAPAPKKKAKTTKAEKPVKTAKKAKVVIEEAVAGYEDIDADAAPELDEEYEPTPEELQMEWRNLADGIPGVKKR